MKNNKKSFTFVALLRKKCWKTRARMEIQSCYQDFPVSFSHPRFVTIAVEKLVLHSSDYISSKSIRKSRRLARQVDNEPSEKQNLRILLSMPVNTAAALKHTKILFRACPNLSTKRFFSFFFLSWTSSIRNLFLLFFQHNRLRSEFEILISLLLLFSCAFSV